MKIVLLGPKLSTILAFLDNALHVNRWTKSLPDTRFSFGPPEGARQNASVSHGKDGVNAKGAVVNSGGGGGDHAYAALPVCHSPAYAKPHAEAIEAQTTWAQNAGELGGSI